GTQHVARFQPFAAKKAVAKGFGFARRSTPSTAEHRVSPPERCQSKKSIKSSRERSIRDGIATARGHPRGNAERIGTLGHVRQRGKCRGQFQNGRAGETRESA